MYRIQPNTLNGRAVYKKDRSEAMGPCEPWAAFIAAVPGPPNPLRSYARLEEGTDDDVDEKHCSAPWRSA